MERGARYGLPAVSGFDSAHATERGDAEVPPRHQRALIGRQLGKFSSRLCRECWIRLQERRPVGMDDVRRVVGDVPRDQEPLALR